MQSSAGQRHSKLDDVVGPLEVVGRRQTDKIPASHVVGSGMPPRSPSHTKTLSDGGALSRSPRPSDVYAAAVAELSESEGRALPKIRIHGHTVSNGRAASPSSPARRRALSAITAGATSPGLSPVNTPGSILALSSLRREHSNLASAPDGEGEGILGGGSLQPGQLKMVSPGLSPPQHRRVASAPDSQTQHAHSHTAVDPWRLEPLSVHSGTGIVLSNNGGLPLGRVVPVNLLFEGVDSPCIQSPTGQPQPSRRSRHGDAVGHAAVAAAALRSSPSDSHMSTGSNESPPVNRVLSQRITVESLSPHTPTADVLTPGALAAAVAAAKSHKPRPPDERAPRTISGRSRRHSSVITSPEQQLASSPNLGPDDGQALDSPQMGGSGGTGTGGIGSRPGSGRIRAVQMLLDAVRSKDDTELTEVLVYLRMPHGGCAGLNERHPVTGRTALHEAVMLNNTAMVQALLTSGSDPDIGHSTQGPPLLHAAAWGEREMTELLLTSGADIAATDVAGYTALHYACAGGHVDAARLLIKRGANIKARTHEGEAPLDLAKPDVVRQLFSSYVASPLPAPPSSAGTSSSGVSGGSGPRSLTRATVSLNGRSPGDAVAAGSGRRGTSLFSPLGPGLGAGSGGASERDCAVPGLQRQESAPAGQLAVAATMAVAASRHRPADALAVVQRPRRMSKLGEAADSPPQLDGSPTSTYGSPAPGMSGSPLPSDVSDGESAPPMPPPPRLQLPRGVVKQLSRGAAIQDIVTSFQQEDQILVKALAASSTAWPPPLPPSGSRPRSGRTSTSRPTSAGLAGGSAPGNGVTGELSTPEDAAARMNSLEISLAPRVRVGAGGGWSLGGGGGGGHTVDLPLQGRDELDQLLTPALVRGGSGRSAFATAPTFGIPDSHLSPANSLVNQASVVPECTSGPSLTTLPSQSSALKLAVPVSAPRFRFGCDINLDSPMQAAAAAAEAAVGPGAFAGGGLAAMRSGSNASSSALSRAASGNAPLPPRGVSGLGAGAPTAGMPPMYPHAGATLPSAATVAAAAAAVAAAASAATVGSSGRSSRRATGDAADSYGSCGTGDASSDTLDSGTGAPPLMVDSSPLGSPRGGRNSPRQDGTLRGRTTYKVWEEGAQNPLRISQAAEALASRAGNASQEALHARAAALFGKSLEMSTGDLQWTRGELLGAGAYGKVYAGLNQQTGELMAVKVLELMQKSGPSSDARQQLVELEQELELYKKLSHRHVVGYIAAHYDPSSSTLLIFLEYVPGGSISSMLDRFGKFSEDLVRNYTRQLLLGLEYLHSSRIVHRDLKGGNILVSRDGVVKLADFGASKAYKDATITDCMKSLRGSVFWMAPEVIKGTGYGRRADIWSLGCTVVEMMTGKHPWPDLENHWIAMFQIAKTSSGPPRPRTANPLALDFLSQCFQVDPAKRPTATQLLQHPFVNGADVTRHVMHTMGVMRQ